MQLDGTHHRFTKQLDFRSQVRPTGDSEAFRHRYWHAVQPLLLNTKLVSQPSRASSLALGASSPFITSALHPCAAHLFHMLI